MINHLPLQELPIVQSGSPQSCFVGTKSQRSDQPQFGFKRNTRPTHGARVRGYLWLKQHNVKARRIAHANDRMRILIKSPLSG